MRYLVLSWPSIHLREYRKHGWHDDAEAAWEVAARLNRHPHTRLALVIAVPDKPKRDLLDMIAEEAGAYFIDRAVRGTEDRSVV